MFVGAPPDLDDPALIQRGAGHYENGCAPCHGAPAASRNPIARHMLPAPPALAGHAKNWGPEELYWITPNGIKMAGMPAWPAQQRTDEPWALTAFLRHLPAMGGEEYRRLAFGEVPADGQSRMIELEGLDQNVLETCARCHGLELCRTLLKIDSVVPTKALRYAHMVSSTVNAVHRLLVKGPSTTSPQCLPARPSHRPFSRMERISRSGRGPAARFGHHNSRRLRQ